MTLGQWLLIGISVWLIGVCLLVWLDLKIRRSKSKGGFLVWWMAYPMIVLWPLSLPIMAVSGVFRR